MPFSPLKPSFILASDGNHHLSLYINLPLIIDASSIDGVVYIPTSIEQTHSIITTLYGVNINSPPNPIIALDFRRASGNIPNPLTKTTWETRTESEWKQLSKAYHFNRIFTPKAWKLNLKTPQEFGKMNCYYVI